MARQDGGPAFPFTVRTADGAYVDADEGLSIRDWFAGQALTGMLASGDNGTDEASMRFFASDSYALADAMLKAREDGQ